MDRLSYNHTVCSLFPNFGLHSLVTTMLCFPHGPGSVNDFLHEVQRKVGEEIFDTVIDNSELTNIFLEVWDEVMFKLLAGNKNINPLLVGFYRWLDGHTLYMITENDPRTFSRVNSHRQLTLGTNFTAEFSWSQ